MHWDDDDFDYPIDDEREDFVFTISFPNISTVKELLEKANKINFPYESEETLRVGITDEDVPVIILDFNAYNDWQDDPLTVEECWKKIEASMFNSVTGLTTQFEYQYNDAIRQEFSWFQACDEHWPEEAQKLRRLEEWMKEEIRNLLD